MLENALLREKGITTSAANDGEEIVNLLDPTFYIPNANVNGNSLIVSRDFIARPDLLGLQLYDKQEYGNLICKINGISNPFELNEEQYLFVPNPTEVTSFFARDWDEDEIVEEETIFEEKVSNETNQPTPKLKSEKRAPNESVIGDNRFRVNYSKRIVVY